MRCELKHMIMAHHGVFIASPEYTASVTPLVKNAIDWVSRVRERGDADLCRLQEPRLRDRRRLAGPSGGLRSLMALRQILELGCGALVIPEQVAIPQRGAGLRRHGQYHRHRAPPIRSAPQLDAPGRNGAADDVRSGK